MRVPIKDQNACLCCSGYSPPKKLSDKALAWQKVTPGSQSKAKLPHVNKLTVVCPFGAGDEGGEGEEREGLFPLHDEEDDVEEISDDDDDNEGQSLQTYELYPLMRKLFSPSQLGSIWLVDWLVISFHKVLILIFL